MTVVSHRFSYTFNMALCSAAALFMASNASAQHAGDVFLDVVDDQIVTGQVHSDQTIEIPVYVFPGMFGDSGFPGFTTDPGFDALPGTFDPDTAISFSVLDELKIWTGDGFDPTAGETLEISSGPQSVTTGDGPVEGFEVSVQSNGGWHTHFGYTLHGPAGEPADDGIYLLELSLHSTDPAIESSPPFWKVFNHNKTPADHDEAVAWAEANLADPPHCPADLTGNGTVGGADLGVLLSAWGDCADPGACPADLTGDGTVGGADLGVLLSEWGACPAS